MDSHIHCIHALQTQELIHGPVGVVSVHGTVRLTRVVTLIGTIRHQPMDTKRGPIRSQESARRQEQEMGLVQPHHLLHGALPGSRGADELGPMVPPQHASEELRAARRAGIDQERQPFLAWRGRPCGVQ